MFDYFSIQYSFRLNDQISYKSDFEVASLLFIYSFELFILELHFLNFGMEKNFSVSFSIVE